MIITTEIERHDLIPSDVVFDDIEQSINIKSTFDESIKYPSEFGGSIDGFRFFNKIPGQDIRELTLGLIYRISMLKTGYSRCEVAIFDSHEVMEGKIAVDYDSWISDYEKIENTNDISLLRELFEKHIIEDTFTIN